MQCNGLKDGLLKAGRGKNGRTGKKGKKGKKESSDEGKKVAGEK